MDSLDLLENFTAVFFTLLPLLGWTMQRRLTEIVFGGTNYDLQNEQKQEIFRRFEFVSILAGGLVTTQALVLTVLAYHHAAFWGVLAAVGVGYLGLAGVLWLWNLGPVGFRLLHPFQQFLVAMAPFLLLVTKIVVVLISVGIEPELLPKTGQPATESTTRLSQPEAVDQSSD